MARVLGIGGVFFKAKDPGALISWYRDVIGLELQDWGGVVFRPEAMAAHPGAGTVFTAFEAETTYFAPSTAPFMLNLVVDDLDAVLARVRAEGVEVIGTQDESYGRFAWIADPDGLKLELWQAAPDPADG